ncbi:hypothetical protein D3C76_1512910 [compost metagenome]
MGIPGLVAIPVVVVVARIAIIEAGGQQEVDALATKVAAGHPLLADMVTEALGLLIAAGIYAQGIDHQIDPAALVAGVERLPGVTRGARGGRAAIQGEVEPGGAVLIVAHRQAD